jgi:phosphohistidine phosphatase
MNLYLIRHAAADSPSEGVADADRPLTDKARERMVRVVSGLRKLGVQPELILASPLKRAADTAAIVAEGLGKVPIETLRELSPGSDLSALIAKLRPHLGLRELALVGHQPDLVHLAAFLLSGLADTCEVTIRKGGVAFLTGDLSDPAARFTLDWLLPPKVLRRL